MVVQLKTQQSATPGLEGRSSQELTVLIANLSTRNNQLRDEVTTLERQAAALVAGDGAATRRSMRSGRTSAGCERGPGWRRSAGRA